MYSYKHTLITPNNKEYCVSNLKTLINPIVHYTYQAIFLSQEQNVTKAAVHLYRSLNMTGFSRSEFIFIDDEPYFLEMNTVPGMTEASLLPQQAAIAGITLSDLLTDTIERN